MSSTRRRRGCELIVNVNVNANANVFFSFFFFNTDNGWEELDVEADVNE